MKSLAVMALAAIANVSAFAGSTSVNFSFDTQTIGSTTVPGLIAGVTKSGIETYMNAVLSAAGCTGCSVTVLVSGSAIGAVTDRTYNGEGHVTGPGSTPTKSLTLGTSDGATASNTASSINSGYDTFLANTTDGSSQISQQITLQFKNITGLTIKSFDYEVFPDGSCPVLNTASCGALSGGHYANQPDLIFAAGNGTNGAYGAGGDAIQTTFWGVTPNTTDGNATKSPIKPSGTELTPQAIGTWSGSLTGVSELDFVDWPATIGIDNLQVSFTTPAGVPEPTNIILLGSLVAGFLARKKLRKN